MQVKKMVSAILICIGSIGMLQAQPVYRRIDTTMKLGKVGYKVNCRNSSPLRNMLSISPIGFEKDAHEASFEIKGRLANTEVDDINRDGYPDLVMYIYTNDSIPKGTVMAVTSEKNEAMSFIYFPDIYNDSKLRPGYKGNDSFFLMEGYLVRRFPVYPGEGAPPAAAAGNLVRQIMYQVVPDEHGFKFTTMRSYDFTK
jgi:hypothetical protein